MTIDTGLKPEGAPERSLIAGATPLGIDTRTEALFRPTQDGGGGAFTWGRLVKSEIQRRICKTPAVVSASKV